MYKIKEIPSDFIVDEISNINLKESGRFAYFLLKKTNYNTLSACAKIANILNLKTKDIGFAGNKDKHAITSQLVSIPANKKESTLKLDMNDITLEFKGYGEKPISLGDLDGNKFTITVRGLDNTEYKEPKEIPNFFGPQRFSKNNDIIGKKLIKKDFKGACELIIESDKEYADKIKDHLDNSQNDFIGALRLIPLKILKLYVHAYQSYLFNYAVKEYLRKEDDSKNIDFQIIGFGSDIDDEIIENIYDDLLEKEDIDYRDFIIRELPTLSAEGDLRKLFIEIKDFKMIEESNDELNDNKKKITVSFSLKKGSYATVVIDNLFS